MYPFPLPVLRLCISFVLFWRGFIRSRRRRCWWNIGRVEVEPTQRLTEALISQRYTADKGRLMRSLCFQKRSPETWGLSTASSCARARVCVYVCVSFFVCLCVVLERLSQPPCSIAVSRKHNIVLQIWNLKMVEKKATRSQPFQHKGQRSKLSRNTDSTTI